MALHTFYNSYKTHNGATLNTLNVLSVIVVNTNKYKHL